MEANNLIQVVGGCDGILQVGEVPNGKLSNSCYPPSAACIDCVERVVCRAECCWRGRGLMRKGFGGGSNSPAT